MTSHAVRGSNMACETTKQVYKKFSGYYIQLLTHHLEIFSIRPIVIGEICPVSTTPRIHENITILFCHKLGSSPHAQILCVCTSVVVYEYEHTCMCINYINHKTNECSRYMYSSRVLSGPKI